MNHEGIDAAEESLTEEHAPAGQLNDDGPDPVEGQSKSQIDDKAEHLGQKAAHQRKLQSPSCIFDGLNNKTAVEIRLGKSNFWDQTAADHCRCGDVQGAPNHRSQSNPQQNQTDLPTGIKCLKNNEQDQRTSHAFQNHEDIVNQNVSRGKASFPPHCPHNFERPGQALAQQEDRERLLDIAPFHFQVEISSQNHRNQHKSDPDDQEAKKKANCKCCGGYLRNLAPIPFGDRLGKFPANRGIAPPFEGHGQSE